MMYQPGTSVCATAWSPRSLYPFDVAEFAPEARPSANITGGLTLTAIAMLQALTVVGTQTMARSTDERSRYQPRTSDG
jgi:hypothetical protein